MHQPLTCTLGRTGLQVSLLGYGAEPLGRRTRSFEDAQSVLNAVLDGGVSIIDTAAAYGRSEEFIGRAIAARKDEFTLVTKCGYIGEYRPAWSPRQIAATVDTSLRNLRMDCIDVLLLHSCGLDELKEGDAIEAVQRVRDQGKARFVGYSGDNDALGFAVASGVFDVIEASFNMLDQANAPHLDEAARRGMGVLIKRPLANAVPGRDERPRSDYAAQYWPRWQTLALTTNDADGLPWLEAAARFSAFRPGVCAILVGSSRAEHVLAHRSALDRGPLPPHIIKRLTSAFARAGGAWPALG